jgi:cytochrome P450
MPAFNFRHIKELYPIFWAKSQEMVACIDAQLKETAPDNAVEIGEWISRATLDIIGLAGMGQSFNALKDPDTKLNRVYRNVFQPSGTAQILGLLQFFIPNSILRVLPLKRNDDLLAASQVARETSRQLIQAKKEKMEKKETLPPDIISIALESGGFTEEQLVDNMMTFLAAGHETTASSFTWAVYLLCQKPEVQTKLREAIHANISSLSDSMDHVKLDGIAYLHAVCNEVLRLYSPVPLTLRDAAHDTTILGQFVPKTTKIIISPWAINHNKQLWGEDAAEFNPDRWMAPGQTNSGGAASNYAFLTFLHGPRSCIGQRFAIAEMACLLAAFVGKYEFEMVDPHEKIEIKGGATARPKNGMHIKLKAVDVW